VIYSSAEAEGATKAVSLHVAHVSIDTVGIILMIAGVAGLILGLSSRGCGRGALGESLSRIVLRANHRRTSQCPARGPASSGGL
jgi:hypothetical protein